MNPAYSFDDIKPAVELLADLYADLVLEQPEPPLPGEPYRAAQVLAILGRLRERLSNDDGRRFDSVLEKIVATKAEHTHKQRGR